MFNILTIVNTAILVILFGDKIYQVIKTKILDKTTLDEKIIIAVKDIASKIKN